MPQREMGYGRDRIYPQWHRMDSTARFVGARAARTLAMIDVDAALWVEYDDGDKQTIALMETARDTGQNVKPATVLKHLAQRCDPIVPAYVVLYRPSEESNPADPKVPDIQMFRVKRVWPEPETPWMTLTPAQWARHLLALRKWYAERIARRLAA